MCPLVSSSASADLVNWGEDKPEAYVVVRVLRPVVVPVGRAAVLGVVVPAAAAIDAVRASMRTQPQSG